MEETTTPAAEVLLVDLSSIAYPLWHMNQGEPDPNSTSRKIVAKVRELAKDHAHAAICKDSGRSFRKDLTDTYKANRPESDATLQHQIRLACDQFAALGFPVWGAAGFEADDVLASAAARSIEAGFDVMVVSDDKDLLQLVGGPVRQFRPTKAQIYDAAKVKEEYGIEPGQMVDYLALVGDKADNIYGANGIGPKTASVLLQTYRTLDAVLQTLTERPDVFKPAAAKSLDEFRPRVALVRQLIELRLDAPVPFDEVLQPRTAAAAPVSDFNPDAIDEGDDMENNETAAALPEVVATGASVQPEQPKALAVVERPTVPAVVEVVPFERALEPRNLKDARQMALEMFQSGMFSAYGSPQAVFATIALGREMGIPMMASLRQIHVVEGKQTLSAQLMVALVLRSGVADYFRPKLVSSTRAVWETKRKGSEPFELEHTIEMAQTAGLVKAGSGWAKNPADMLNARCSSRLARLIYPDIIGNLYTPEEIQDDRAEAAALARVVA